jgi:hypothetical protein
LRATTACRYPYPLPLFISESDYQFTYIRKKNISSLVFFLEKHQIGKASLARPPRNQRVSSLFDRSKEEKKPSVCFAWLIHSNRGSFSWPFYSIPDLSQD